MKPILIFSLLMVVLCSFTTPSTEPAGNLEQRSRLALEALRHYSLRKYESLFPTMDDFTALMNQHAQLYGNNLAEARKDFIKIYKKKVIPALHHSFQELVNAGKEKGIDWGNVTFVRAESVKTDTLPVMQSDLRIVFSYNQQQFALRIKDALLINGKWYVTQFASLEQL